MRYVSLFSGIEAATVAWHPLGWTPLAFAEVDKFPAALLAHHYPDVPNMGDVTKADWGEFKRANGPIDVVVFGSPCQSFSVAGKRLGLDDPRGNLALYALGVVRTLQPRYFVFENVPGLLSSAEGRDFGAFLGAVGECGYQCAWRVLDAQHFGLAQRRQRVFVVGHLGDWRRAAAVLFERESLSGHPAPRREAGQGVTAGTLRGTDGGLDCDHAAASHCVPVAPTLRAGGNRTGGDRPPGTDVDTCDSLIIAHSLRADGFDASEDGTGRGTPIILDDQGGSMMNISIDGKVGTLMRETHGNLPIVAFYARQSDVIQYGDMSGPLDTDGHTIGLLYQDSQYGVGTYDSAGSLRAGRIPEHQMVMPSAMQVRRLTPMECERLQGFSDNYTLIPYRGKPAADGPRYKALGNSMAVPCMAWIGRRIAAVQSICAELERTA